MPGLSLALTVSSWMRCVMVCAAFLCAWKRLMMLVLSGSRMFSSSSRTTRSSARILRRPGQGEAGPGAQLGRWDTGLFIPPGPACPCMGTGWHGV